MSHDAEIATTDSLFDPRCVDMMVQHSGDIHLGAVLESTCPSSRVVHDEPLLLSWPSWKLLTAENLAYSNVWFRNYTWKERATKVTSQIVAPDVGLDQQSHVV